MGTSPDSGYEQGRGERKQNKAGKLLQYASEPRVRRVANSAAAGVNTKKSHPAPGDGKKSQQPKAKKLRKKAATSSLVVSKSVEEIDKKAVANEHDLVNTNKRFSQPDSTVASDLAIGQEPPEHELALHDYVNLAECQQMMAAGDRVTTPPGTHFPNVIGYASTQHILALYGNPRTPLLPNQPAVESQVNLAHQLLLNYHQQQQHPSLLAPINGVMNAAAAAAQSEIKRHQGHPGRNTKTVSNLDLRQAAAFVHSQNHGHAIAASAATEDRKRVFRMSAPMMMGNHHQRSISNSDVIGRNFQEGMVGMLQPRPLANFKTSQL